MLIDATRWEQIGALFDQVATLTPAQREAALAQPELDAASRSWLQKMLAAHDSSTTELLDQSLGQIATDLLGAADDGEIPAQLDGALLGHWRVGAQIARGAMAAVFHGQRADGAYQQHVAIKLLQPGPYRVGERAQLSEELRLLARLEHPGIARLIDGGISAQGWPYLVMEYVDGWHIDQWCRTQKLDWRQRLQLLRKVCDAVRYAHDKLVVHADIKPSNVLVNRDGEVKLVDFGIAGLLRSGTDRSVNPASLLLRCSPAYAAPEQLRGAPVATSHDVFGLGALLYELLSGRRIRDGKTVTALLLGHALPDRVLALHRSTNRRLPSGVSGKDLDAICRQALAHDPRHRYGSVSELQQDLHNTLRRYPVAARANTVGYRWQCWLRRNYLLAGAVAAVVLALVGGATAALWQAQRADLAAAQSRASALAASAARAEAESALARADAINAFLVGLFQADVPRLPSAQMPTTREVVETGIKRARDPATGPPEVRASLLLTLGNVILHHLEPDRAEQLLDDAERLIGEYALDNPRIRIDALLLRADIAMVRDQADNVAAAADQAIALLEANRPDSLELLEIMRLRAQAERRIGTLADARQRFEQIYARTAGRDDADVLRLKLAQDLAVIAGLSQDYQAAITQFEEVLRLKKARADTLPNQLATTECNIGAALVELGEFERARTRLRQALDDLAEIDAPNPVRASALLSLGDIDQLQGRLDPALAQYREGAREWARVKDLQSSDDDYLIHHLSALALAGAGQIDAAAESMQRAIERMQTGDRYQPPQRIAAAQATLAALHCQAGRVQAAKSLLAAIDGKLDASLSPELATARGECALATPDADPDPALVPLTVIAEHARAPGRAIETAALELLRARLLARAGNPDAARQLLAAAAARIAPLHLADPHPLRAAIHQLRSQLSAR